MTVSMIRYVNGPMVRLPSTFWHPEIRLPRAAWHPGRSYDEMLTEERSRLLESYRKLKQQEETGQVSESVILQTLLSAWALRRSWRMSQDSQVSPILAEIPALAKKYGLSKIWNAALWDTMVKRVEQLFADEAPGAERFRCGRCGRAIWNPLSVKRGLGPICYHKPR